MILAISTKRKSTALELQSKGIDIGHHRLKISLRLVSIFIHSVISPTEKTAFRRPCLHHAPFIPVTIQPCKYEPGRITDPISGDGSVVSEAERHCWISQKGLTGERRGGKRDGKWMSGGVFLCCHSEHATSVKHHEHLHVST